MRDIVTATHHAHTWWNSRSRWQSCVLAVAVCLSVIAASFASETKDSTLRSQISELRHAGKYTDAAPLANELVELRIEMHGEDHVFTQEAKVWADTCSFAGSLPESTQSRLGYAERLLSEMIELYRADQFEDALRVAEEQLRIRIDILGERHHDVATTLSNMALFQRQIGMLRASELSQRTALAIFDEHFEGPQRLTANSHHNLAYTLRTRGRRQDAIRHYGLALSMRRSLYGNDHPSTLRTLNGLAVAYIESKQFERALELFATVEQAQRDLTSDEARLELARTLANIADVQMALEQWTDARSNLMESMRIREALLDPNDLDIAWTIQALAELDRHNGHFDSAIQRYRHALEIRLNHTLSSHPDSLRNQLRLAETLLQADFVEEAIHEFEMAANAALESRTSIVGDERDRAYFASAMGWSDILIGYAAALIQADRKLDAADILESAKSRALLDLLERSEADLVAAAHNRGAADALRVALDNESRARDSLAQHESHLTQLLDEASVSDSEIDQARARVLESRQGLAEREQDVILVLHDLFPDAAPLSTHTICESLKAETVALSIGFSRSAVVGFLIPAAESHSVMAWVIASGEEETRDFEALCLRIRNALRSQQWMSSEAAATSLRDFTQTLLPKAARKVLASAHRIVYSPDGPLNQIPIGILPLSGHQTDLMESDIDIAYSTSLSVYLNRTQEADSRTIPTSLTAVIVGDPDYGASNTSSPSSQFGPQAMAIRGVHRDDAIATLSARDQRVLYGDTFEPLPWSRTEATRVSQLLTNAGATTTVLLGDDANVPRLKSEARGAHIIHIAAHGFTGSITHPYEASIALAQPQVISAADSGFLTIDNMIRSWGQWLDDCNLVVISACDSHRGNDIGDSSISLPWGFFYAGAPTVIASLWQVDDAATALLMGRFYENYLDTPFQRGDRANEQVDNPSRLNAAAALRDAQRWLRSLSVDDIAQLDGDSITPRSQTTPRGIRSRGTADRDGSFRPYADPYFWASFVLVGASE